MHGAALRTAVAEASDRRPVGDDGRSGAVLERVVLTDGTRVVVKRFDPAIDLVMRITDDAVGREVTLVESGVLDRLPPTVVHPALAAWTDDDGLGVLVMRDLGDAVLTWKSMVGPVEARTMFSALADLHAAFAGKAPDDLTDLAVLLGMFEPERIRPLADGNLVDYALRGWEYWPEVAPGEIGERVLALALDTSPLAVASRSRPATLLHGDLATVNMAFEPDRPGCLTLIDWGMAGAGPAEVDLGRLLAGCGHLLGGDLDGLVALQREVAGPSYDDDAMRLGLLAGLAWLGWNKALDIVEHPDPAVRAREQVALSWWLRQAELALGTGLVEEE
jgi:hypothetical protein